MELWQSQLATAREVLVTAGLGTADIAAIGIANQRETTVVWNRRTGLPIYNAIVWQDRRAEPGRPSPHCAPRASRRPSAARPG